MSDSRMCLMISVGGWWIQSTAITKIAKRKTSHVGGWRIQRSTAITKIAKRKNSHLLLNIFCGSVFPAINHETHYYNNFIISINLMVSPGPKSCHLEVLVHTVDQLAV